MEDQPIGREYIRYHSILDSEDQGDMFTAYCDRHTRKMKDIQPAVRIDGGIYSMKDPFKVYVCPECLHELAQREQEPPMNIFMAAHMRAFFMWDDGESPGDWFEYLADFEDFNGDAEYIRFDTSE